ncbi:rhodanese-like domain-containing protein [Shewanella intestini]|uniref:Sulfurtransferase n=1 Tax=Shewanella intestini TaxID=2017544 RepID=A0ABS5I0A5_9GAMM|nr:MULTISPECIES: rhodanese-like domain-containing protein [Shewanella]MBR9727455.1 sulfurtransferase [Shewanella intestini]MRG35495.1 sulfurtransferase [Shewanella sp. XMDDZSB0408]
MQHSPGFVALVESIRPKVNELTFTQYEHTPAVLLIDIREDHEWQQGFIPQAVHLGRGIIERDIERLYPDKNQPMVLYCGGGHRSVMSAYHLQLMGYRAVYSLIGGFKAWQQTQ